MAAIENTRALPSANIFGGISKLIAMISAWNEARITRNALSGLSDRELDDIGLSRGDIGRIKL